MKILGHNWTIRCATTQAINCERGLTDCLGFCDPVRQEIWIATNLHLIKTLEALDWRGL